MYATDFEYDGLTLSDFGMMIGSFSSPGTETVSSGADINFHTVSPAGSDRFRFYGTKYEEAFTATLQICKSPCLSDNPYLTPAEISGLQRWLCARMATTDCILFQTVTWIFIGTPHLAANKCRSLTKPPD